MFLSGNTEIYSQAGYNLLRTAEECPSERLRERVASASTAAL